VVPAMNMIKQMRELKNITKRDQQLGSWILMTYWLFPMWSMLRQDITGSLTLHAVLQAVQIGIDDNLLCVCVSLYVIWCANTTLITCNAWWWRQTQSLKCWHQLHIDMADCTGDITVKYEKVCDSTHSDGSNIVRVIYVSCSL
jgi:hypothetical protein